MLGVKTVGVFALIALAMLLTLSFWCFPPQLVRPHPSGACSRPRFESSPPPPPIPTDNVDTLAVAGDESKRVDAAIFGSSAVAPSGPTEVVVVKADQEAVPPVMMGVATTTAAPVDDRSSNARLAEGHGSGSTSGATAGGGGDQAARMGLIKSNEEQAMGVAGVVVETPTVAVAVAVAAVDLVDARSGTMEQLQQALQEQQVMLKTLIDKQKATDEELDRRLKREHYAMRKQHLQEATLRAKVLMTAREALLQEKSLRFLDAQAAAASIAKG